MFASSIELSRILENIYTEDYSTLYSYVEENQDKTDGFIQESFGLISDMGSPISSVDSGITDFEKMLLKNSLDRLNDSIKRACQNLLSSKDPKQNRLGVFFKTNGTIIETYIINLKNELLQISYPELVLNVVRACYKMVLEYVKEFNLVKELEKPKKCIHSSDLLDSKFISKSEAAEIYFDRVYRDSGSSNTCIDLFQKFFELVITKENGHIMKYINNITCRVEEIIDMSEMLVKSSK